MGLVLLASLGLMRPAFATGIPSDAGRPLLRSFGPRDYQADSQNWALVQDPRGLLYAANNFGVLEFDGARWRLIQTRDKTTPRSLALDERGRVFVGAQNEFGYLHPDGFGRMRYVSLDEHLPPAERNFGNVWTTTACSRGVFFVSEKRLFHWDGTRLHTWRAPTAFFMGYGVRDRFLVLDKEKGLLEPEGDALRLIPGGAHFAGLKPRFLVPWQDHGKEVILWGSRAEGLALFDGEGIRKVATRADRYLKENILYAGIRLGDGTLALATIQGGVGILDLRQDRLRILNKEEGILNQTAYCLLEDLRGGLWLGGSKGIEVIGWPAHLSQFDEPEGLSGVPLGMLRHDGCLYVTTNRGLFRMAAEVDLAGRRRFLPVSGVKGQCWDLLALGRSLLVASYDGVYEVQGLRARQIISSTGHTTCFLPDPRDPDRLFIGTVSGLFAFRRTGTSPTWREEGRVAGIHEEIRTLTKGRDGSLWAGFDAPFVLRVDLSSARSTPTVERFGAPNGLPEDPWFFTTELGGQPVVYGSSGVYCLDTQARRFQPDPRVAPLRFRSEQPLFRLVEGPEGSLWAGCQAQGTSLRRATLGPDGRYRWVGAPVECSEAPVYALHPESDGTFWFGGEAGLFRQEPPAASASEPPASVLIRSALKKGGIPVSLSEGDSGSRIPYVDNTLRLEFALPRLGPVSIPRYQIQLLGHDADWSPWTTETYRDYTNLKAGRYTFRVRARMNDQEDPTETTFAFQILRPWFQTWWAYGLYALGATLVMGAAHRMRVRLLRRRNRELEIRVAEATQALTRQATELAWMNQELRDLNEQKNHFLGIVSHDLKSPLNGIVMAAETLKTTQDVRLANLTAQSIETEGLAMGALIERFLSVTALESGRIAVHPVNLDARTCLAEAQARHRAMADTKGIPLSLEPGMAPAWAFADPLLLGEILDNLISNAIKFSPAGAPVNLCAKAHGERIRVSIEDHGPGLQPQDHRKLFHRFSRLSARPTGGERSVGLGLSIARQMVEAMGGRIWAEEARRGGATFHVELPGGRGTDS
jgi:signal transduction histidine kinase/ligand-binding sensor domain-containing protein